MIKKYKVDHVKIKYRISKEQLASIYDSQAGLCAACGLKPNIDEKRFWGQKLTIDHDHKTGAIRGLLCQPCNAALGQVQDNTNTLLRLVAYLNRKPVISCDELIPKDSGSWNRSKTHCKNGHEYNLENTYRNPFNNHRQCIICRRKCFHNKKNRIVSKPFLLTLLSIFICSISFADITKTLNVEESDGSPSTFPYKLKVSSGSLTDNGDGTATLTTGGGTTTPGGGDGQVQYNNAGVMSGDPIMVFNNVTNTLIISKDAGQLGEAIRISNDTGGVVANISHDGSIFVQNIQQAAGKSISIGASNGIIMTSDSAGVFKLGGRGGTNNENLTFDTETDSNAIDISSSTGVTQLFFQPANFGLTWKESGNAVNVANIRYDQTGNDSLRITTKLGSATASGNIVICELADIGTDFSIPIATDPTLVLQGADATQTSERGRMVYDSVRNQFVISSDTGPIILSSTNGTFLRNTLIMSPDVGQVGIIKMPDASYISDGNGNNLLSFDTVASAVNHLSIFDSATGTNPILSADGTDANVGIGLNTRGTGAVVITSGPTATASSINAGLIVNNSAGSLTAGRFQVMSSDSTTIISADPSIGGASIKALTLLAGGTPANTSPLKMVSGSVLSTPEAGSVEYNGKSFYGTPNASNRGVIPTMLFTRNVSNFVGTNVNTPQPVFEPSHDTVTLAANTLYKFDALYSLARSAGNTSHTTSINFGGTVVSSDMIYEVITHQSTGASLTTTSADVAISGVARTATQANASTTENLSFMLDGMIAVTTSGTLIPQIQYSTAPGGVPTISRDSFFILYPISSDTIDSVGNWA